VSWQERTRIMASFLDRSTQIKSKFSERSTIVGEPQKETLKIDIEGGTTDTTGSELNTSIEEGWNLVSESIGLDRESWEAYKEEIAKIESRGSGGYQAKGGSGDKYDGKYQLGEAAKIDASAVLGVELKHDQNSRESFRSNPSLQEKAFAAYTLKNHQYMMADPNYKNLSPKQKVAVLAYAHNQGHGGAKAFLKTGEERRDAFGTKATKYSNALMKRLDVSIPSPSKSTDTTINVSLRPKIRPEQ